MEKNVLLYFFCTALDVQRVWPATRKAPGTQMLYYSSILVVHKKPQNHFV
ncbi:MAG: hypothetical protein ACI90V_006514, partial [Bacillariaceae sp.]